MILKFKYEGKKLNRRSNQKTERKYLWHLSALKMLFMDILWKKFMIIKEIYDFFAHLNSFSLLTCTFLLFYFKQTLKIKFSLACNIHPFLHVDAHFYLKLPNDSLSLHRGWFLNFVAKEFWWFLKKEKNQILFLFWNLRQFQSLK